MKKTYEAPIGSVERQFVVEDAVSCSGGPIILPDDDFQ